MNREPTNQVLLDRYVYTIRTMLSPEDADDVTAEIRSNLESQREDQALILGRDLSSEELSAILKQHGHPMLVARRYRDAGWGVSPELFAFYRFSLGGLLALIFTILLVKAAYIFPGRLSLSSFLLQVSRELLVGGIIVTGLVTLIFLGWEYLERKNRFGQKWDPRTLPAIPRPGPQPRQPGPAVTVIGQAAWLSFLGIALFSPWLSWIWGGRGHFDLSSAGSAMRLPLWLIAAFAVSQGWLNFTPFASAGWRRFLRIALYLAGLAFSVAAVRAGDFLVPGTNWDPYRNASSLVTLNRMIAGSAALACVLLSLGLVHELRCYLRRLRSGQTARARVD